MDDRVEPASMPRTLQHTGNIFGINLTICDEFLPHRTEGSLPLPELRTSHSYLDTHEFPIFYGKGGRISGEQCARLTPGRKHNRVK